MSAAILIPHARITFSAPPPSLRAPPCREETSNNRVRSGMNPRPIDFVPGAGARRGTADGIETTDAPLGIIDTDVEQGEANPVSPMLLPPTPTTARGPGSTPTTPTADAAIPHLQV